MNYEQKYKEALKWMQSLYKGLHGATKEDAEHYFPELKESEDERMKKAIKHVLYENYSDAAVIEGVEIAEIVAWLEKCGEQTHAELCQSEVTKTLDPDKVIEWLECDAFQSWGEPIDIRPIIRKFKKDFSYDTTRRKK